MIEIIKIDEFKHERDDERAMCSMPDDTPTKVYKLDENKVEVP